MCVPPGKPKIFKNFVFKTLVEIWFKENIGDTASVDEERHAPISGDYNLNGWIGCMRSWDKAWDPAQGEIRKEMTLSPSHWR